MTEAAAALGVGYATIKRWVAQGRVESEPRDGPFRMVRMDTIDPEIVKEAHRLAEARYGPQKSYLALQREMVSVRARIDELEAELEVLRPRKRRGALLRKRGDRT